jgi:hypothetical protein
MFLQNIATHLQDCMIKISHLIQYQVHNTVGLSSVGDVDKTKKHILINIRHAVIFMMIHEIWSVLAFNP